MLQIALGLLVKLLYNTRWVLRNLNVDILYYLKLDVHTHIFLAEKTGWISSVHLCAQETFSGHTSPITRCRYSASGANIASSSTDGTVRWNVLHLVLSTPAQCDFRDLFSDGSADLKAVVGSNPSAHLENKYLHMKLQLSSKVKCVVIQDMGTRCHSSDISKCNYNDWGWSAVAWVGS